MNLGYIKKKNTQACVKYIGIDNNLINRNCKQCLEYVEETVCHNCGLVNNEQEMVNISFVNPEEKEVLHRHYSTTLKFNKIIKMQEWFKYTEEEKIEYKLSCHIKLLCEKLNIKSIGCIDQITILVSKVMHAIKDDYNGPKRARVKDGIIIMCIHYISKNVNLPEITSTSYLDFAKLINLDTKFISRADKLIMDLISRNKLVLPQEFINNILHNKKPLDYVLEIIKKYNLDKNLITKNIITKIEKLIEICEDNDLILNCNPLTVGVTCFYYVLKLPENNFDIDLKLFASIYDLSIVTVLKTYNTLKLKQDKINKLIN